MKSRFISVLLITLFVANLNIQAKDYTAAEIRSYYQAVLDQTSQLATKQPLDKEGIRQMLSTHMDINWMANFSLGKHKKQLTQSENDEYIAAYRDWILRRAEDMFSKHYQQGRIVIRDVSSSSNGFFIKTEVKSAEGETINVTYGIKVVGEEQPKIIDIIVEHVSTIVTDKDIFDNILNQKGIKGLIEELTKR